MNSSKKTLTVIGTGPGGYVAAVRASQLGFKVSVIERDRPGGICLNWGCIPTKALLKSAEMYEKLKKGGMFGLKTDGLSYDLTAVVDRSRGISDRMATGVEYLFRKFNINHIKGTAKFKSAKELTVENGKETSTVKSDIFVIATGARPRDLPGIERDGERILSYKEAMIVKELPKRLAVIGAGAIGMEFAYYYGALGSNVTVLEAMDRVLPVEDDEISSFVAKSFTRQGIKIETNALVSSVKRKGDEVNLEYEAGGQKKKLTADICLVAIGVVPNIENLNLEKIGVKTSKKGITVNEHMLTDVQNIYAIGDVIGPPWLAHVASAEGVHAVEHAAGHTPQPINYDIIPGCTYCHPEVASVGYSERRAKELGIEYKVGKFSLKANGRAIASSDSDGLVKLIFEKKYGGLIGAHMVGGDATEMIHEMTLGMAMEATAEEIGRTVHAHPTMSESIMEAALDVLGERIHGA